MTESAGRKELHEGGKAKPLTVTMIIATYNEADIIVHTMKYLVSQGILVYLINTNSTDATVTKARRFLDRGLWKQFSCLRRNG